VLASRGDKQKNLLRFSDLHDGVNNLSRDPF